MHKLLVMKLWPESASTFIATRQSSVIFVQKLKTYVKAFSDFIWTKAQLLL